MTRNLFRTASSTLLILFLASLAYGGPSGKIRKKVPPWEYGSVIMNKSSEAAGVKPVVFRHWTHRSKHTCRLCHVDIGFSMEKGADGISKEENFQGMYCGVCHNGKEAFDLKKKSNCQRCHSPYPLGRDPHVKREFFKLASKLPKARDGNKIDWTKAEEMGLIKPKDFIPGVSFPRSKMKHEHGDIRLDAKLAGLQDIIFSHKKHAVWNGCELCHPDIFALKTGMTKFTMQDNFSGRYCGACHGKVAFPQRDCGLCHVKQPGK